MHTLWDVLFRNNSYVRARFAATSRTNLTNAMRVLNECGGVLDYHLAVRNKILPHVSLWWRGDEHLRELFVSKLTHVTESIISAVTAYNTPLALYLLSIGKPFNTMVVLSLAIVYNNYELFDRVLLLSNITYMDTRVLKTTIDRELALGKNNLNAFVKRVDTMLEIQPY